MENNEEEHLVELDSITINCADYFAKCVLTQFPNLKTDMKMLAPYRLIWFITLPSQEYSVSEVEEFCFKLMDRLFWEKDELISYTIMREDNE